MNAKDKDASREGWLRAPPRTEKCGQCHGNTAEEELPIRISARGVTIRLIVFCHNKLTIHEHICYYITICKEIYLYKVLDKIKSLN